MYSFISGHITIDNYYLLLLCEIKKLQSKMEINGFKKFLLKIVWVIISMTY